MKTLKIAALVCFALTITSAVAQGPLAPSGAPAATMKTLDQVEARIPITQIPYTCEVAGASYYLTGDLVGIAGAHGILISASDVTLDLNGFTLYGDSGSGSTGISGAPDADNLLIFNGSVRDWGATFYGVECAGEYVTVSGVRSFNNGGGIMLSDNSSAVDCVAANNSSGGIIVRHNGRVENCVASSNGWHGIYGWKSNLVRNCKAAQNGSSGIELQGGGQMTDNTSLNNGTGLRITLSGTYVADNIVRGNTDNYDLGSGNQLNLLLCEIPEILDWPCSVKLNGTLTTSAAGATGIIVNADNVTIDLDGHALIGAGASSGNGVYQSSAFRSLKVQNGMVSGWRGTDKYGVGAFGWGSVVYGLQAVSNTYGIRTGESAEVYECMSTHNAKTGIYVANGSRVRDCMASYNQNHGISTAYGCTVQDCFALENSYDGISLGNSCNIMNCTATDNLNDGISARYNNRIVDNYCHGNVWAGIHTLNFNNHIEANNVQSNGKGIDVDSTESLIIRNAATGNSTNYTIASDNKVGTIVDAPNSGAISGSSGGAGVGTTDPWANFSY